MSGNCKGCLYHPTGKCQREKYCPAYVKAHNPEPNEGGSVGSNGSLVTASQAPTVASEPIVYNSPIGARTVLNHKPGGVICPYCNVDLFTEVGLTYHIARVHL